MIFKNLTIYSTPKGWLPDFEEMAKHKFQHCGASELATRGWKVMRDDQVYINVGACAVFALILEKRLLPTSVINDATKALALEIEEREGYKPGRKQMKEIKEQAIDSLIPKSFTVRSDVAAYVDPVNGYLVINTASGPKADELIGLLFKCCEDIKIHALTTKKSAGVMLAEWIARAETPEFFSLDDSVELKGRGEKAGTVKFTNENVESEAVLNQIQAGKDPVKAAMTWADRVSFVLNENARVISKVKLLDIKKDVPEVESAQEQEDIDLTIMTGEFSRLINAIVDSLGGVRPREEQS